MLYVVASSLPQRRHADDCHCIYREGSSSWKVGLLEELFLPMDVGIISLYPAQHKEDGR